MDKVNSYTRDRDPDLVLSDLRRFRTPSTKFVTLRDTGRHFSGIALACALLEFALRWKQGIGTALIFQRRTCDIIKSTNARGLLVTTFLRYASYAAYAYVLIGLIVATVGPAGREIRSEFLKLRKGTPKDLAGLGLTINPPQLLWKCLVLAVISTVFATILWPGFWNEVFPSRSQALRPDVPAEWLKERISVEQTEKVHSVRLEDLGPDPVPFGHQNSQWLELRSSMRPGDELWSYSSSAESWAHLAGRAGIAVVRNGIVVAQLVTLMN